MIRGAGVNMEVFFAEFTEDPELVSNDVEICTSDSKSLARRECRQDFPVSCCPIRFSRRLVDAWQDGSRSVNGSHQHPEASRTDPHTRPSHYGEGNNSLQLKYVCLVV